MRITDHFVVTNIRQQLLIRVSYVLIQLSKEFSNKAMANYLNVSIGCCSQLKRFNYHTEGRTPIRNIDRLLRICEKLKIQYEFRVGSKNGRTTYNFESESVVNWGNQSARLPINRDL